MTAIYLKVDPQTGTPTEGGPFTALTLYVGSTLVATGSASGWYVNDGASFGDASLTGTTVPVIWGQSK